MSSLIVDSVCTAKKKTKGKKGLFKQFSLTTFEINKFGNIHIGKDTTCCLFVIFVTFEYCLLIWRRRATFGLCPELMAICNYSISYLYIIIMFAATLYQKRNIAHNLLQCSIDLNQVICSSPFVLMN